MLTLRIMIVLGAIAIPSLASATDRAAAPPAPTEIRLSQAEIDQVLADAATKREARSRQPEAEAEPARRQVHGEVGFEIGTGGYRSVHGTTAIELPNDGFASFSFETSDFGRSNRRER